MEDGCFYSGIANIAAVALANKTAGIAWAMMTKETNYRPELLAA